MSKIRYLLFLLFFANSPVFAQLHFSPIELQTYQCYEKFDFQAANILLTSQKETKITNILLANYSSFLQLLFSENEKLYLQLLNNEQINLLKLEKFKNDTSFLLCQAEIKLQWAFVHLKFGHEWQAFQGVRQSFKLLKESEKLYPNFLAQQKSLGLLYILLSAVPEQYQWTLSFFALSGNEKKGISYLQNVANNTSKNDNFYAKEAQLILVLAQTFILKQTKNALTTIQNYELDAELTNKRENLLQTVILSWSYLKLGRAMQVINLTQKPILKLNNISLLAPFFNFPNKQNNKQNDLKNDLKIRYYLYAEALLLSNNLQLAEKYYIFYLNHLENNSSNNTQENLQENLYVKDCYYKLFLINYLGNNMPKAYENLHSIISQGNTKTVADRYANSFAKKNIEKLQLLNKDLLIVRLLTDGGEYEKSWAKLMKIDSNNLVNVLEKTEYYYRKARILDKQAKYEDALNAYQNVIDFDKKNNSKSGNANYFAPNSCLQIALLYEDIFKEKEKAKYYAKLVSNYKNYEYEKSIEQESKRLLRKL